MTTPTIAAATIEDLFGHGCDCIGGPLGEAIAAGYVRTQDHPVFPLRIFNYTEKAAYEGVWTEVTRTCRGLIVNAATGRIVARPFRKFMNHGQAGADLIALDEPVQIADKLDGSLGIVYPTDGIAWPNGDHAVATRGSFTSDQALHATGVLQDRYGAWAPPPGVTVLVEIVYPANRIVCDYGDRDDLVFLGAVDIATGEVAGPDAAWLLGWPGPRAAVFPARPFAQALAMPPRPNAEGLVIRGLATGAMLKLKQEDYVALHRIVTGLTARTVWQHLVDDKPIDTLIDGLPDEFHPWVRRTADDILAAAREQQHDLVCDYEDVVNAVIAANPWWTNRSQRTTRDGRKAFAAVATSPTYRDRSWALFALLDDRDIYAELLKRARPEPYLTPTGRTFTEDNA